MHEQITWMLCHMGICDSGQPKDAPLGTYQQKQYLAADEWMINVILSKMCVLFK